MKNKLTQAVSLFHRVYDRATKKNEKLSFDLEGVASDLNGLLESIDPHFMGLARLFQSVEKETGQFADDVIGAMEIVRGRDSHDGLSSMKESVSQFVARLEGQRTVVDQGIDGIDKVVDSLARLPKACESAEKVALLLRVIALNIGIESSRLGDAQDMFAAFVEEVAHLSGNIKQVAETLCEDSQALKNTHMGIKNEVQSHAAHLAGLSNVARKDMNVSTDHVHDLMESTLLSMQSATKNIGHIKSHAGDIVVSLQFHDIIRQKIEHMVSSFTEASHKLRQADPSGLRGVLLIQVAQIDEIIKDVHTVYLGARQAFDAIMGYVAEIYIEIGRHSGDNDCDALGVLTSSMESLENIQERVSQMGGRVHQAMGEAFDSANALTGHLDLIAHIQLDLHRKALNAVVKAAHLGDRGKGIEVFAQEVNKASLQTQHFADEVVSVVGNACDITRDIKDDAQVLGDNARERKPLSLSLSWVTQAYEVMDESLVELDGRFKDIEAEVLRARESLGFLDDFLQGLDLVKKKIRTVEQYFIRETSNENDMTDSDLGLHRYTMDSERLAHKTVLSELSQGSGGTNDKAEDPCLHEPSLDDESNESCDDDDTANSTDEELGDNVEFF